MLADILLLRWRLGTTEHYLPGRIELCVFLVIIMQSMYLFLFIPMNQSFQMIGEHLQKIVSGRDQRLYMWYINLWM